MSKSIFDDHIKRAPINKNAVRVAFYAGEHFVSNINPCHIVNGDPLPTRPFPAQARAEHDITGMRHGRLVVVGLLAGDFDLHAKGSAKWVVKCACGNYSTMRRAAFLKDGNHLMCPECSYLEHIKFKDSQRGRQ